MYREKEPGPRAYAYKKIGITLRVSTYPLRTMVAHSGTLSKLPLSSLLGPIEDWRKGNALQYQLNDLIFIGLTGVVGGCESYVEIADFYEDHQEWQQFRIWIKITILEFPQEKLTSYSPQ